MVRKVPAGAGMERGAGHHPEPLDRGPENFSAKSYKIYDCPQFRADPRRAHDKACN